ncbi:MAG: 3'-5' exonuclease [Candidatus Absconditabacteria bacterium]
MLKNLNYIAFDFETTGIDCKKDEPIQIGIIQFNNKFEIINTYSSLIKPKKDIKELKDIVSFITGFKLSDLEDAPYIEDILENIKPFFNENSVLIGHNVDFDISFLNKYISFEYFAKYDTLDFAKQVFHFADSYALEILVEIMKDQGIFNTPEQFQGKEMYHDALYDSLGCYNLFKYYINRIQYLSDKFPVILKFLNSNKGNLSKILSTKDYRPSENIVYFLPPLKLEIKNNIYRHNENSYDLSQYENGSFIYTGNIIFSELLKNLIGKEKYILAFSSRSKMQIAKNILNDLGLKNVSFLNNDYHFDQTKVEFFLGQNQYEEVEVYFLIKYFSLYDKGYGILDLNTPQDYKIYNFLSTISSKTKGNIILTQHNNLYNEIEENNPLLKDYKILFFDKDWWYNTYSRYINQYFDFYYFLGQLEEYVYYEKFIDQDACSLLTEFQGFVVMFMGVLFMELNCVFEGVPSSKLEINPIDTNLDFYKTRDLLDKFTEFENLLSDEYNPRFSIVKNKIKEIKDIMSNIALVEKKMYNQDRYYFIFHKTNNVINFPSFSEHMRTNNILFLSNFDKLRSIQLVPNNEYPEYEKKIIKINNVDNLISRISTYKKLFVLSSQKVTSTNFFQQLFANNIHNDYEIFVENVTGGLGKNMFYAKKRDKLIMIGGVEFLISSIANGVKFDDIVILNIGGPLEFNIIRDIYYYGGFGISKNK